ncbi:hypothetical protein B0J11DRAFT_57697 [Dendryphion nanum]|uniref:Uncharacterized protein n=1 Tax=Dendryphion nanum TaxID=256645 RepID=A0A9P9IIW1_9PLEO|nr:hypothetical protein B0J11DRAFT_57697 [Dendryphion nanum]
MAHVSLAFLPALNRLRCAEACIRPLDLKMLLRPRAPSVCKMAHRHTTIKVARSLAIEKPKGRELHDHIVLCTVQQTMRGLDRLLCASFRGLMLRLMHSTEGCHPPSSIVEASPRILACFATLSKKGKGNV